MNYTQNDLMRLAKRHHNTKRTYLLINPLQGKHLAVSPTKALAMMRSLGKRVADEVPEIDLVIGFAETATAVSAAVAEGLGGCRFIHTTRESLNSGETLVFCEEHSHAVEQRLSLERLRTWIEEASGIALIDDEISTGKTMMNAIEALRSTFPSLASKPLTVASIISRLSEESVAHFKSEGMRCLSLLRLPVEDYSKNVKAFDIQEARRPEHRGMAYSVERFSTIGDMREGVIFPEWMNSFNSRMDGIVKSIGPGLEGKRVTVLGTEEYMYAGLCLGTRLEQETSARSVLYHATTRSPIGVCAMPEYPIRQGWKLRSFYDTERVTYIYNLKPCDTAIVVTDTKNERALAAAMEDLTSALCKAGCRDVILIQEDGYVQHL